MTAAVSPAITNPEDAAHWASVAARLQAMWLEVQGEQALKASVPANPTQWLSTLEDWYQRLPLAQPEAAQKLWEEGAGLWQNLLSQSGLPGASGDAMPKMRHDKRFADPKWQEQPYYALVHQTYLMLAERIVALADSVEGIDESKRQQLRFATQTLVDAFSPDHFPTTNPLVMERAIAERGRFPAINVLKSISRTMPGCQTPFEQGVVRSARQVMAAYSNMEELIRIGAYRRGADALVDRAIALNPSIEAFLTQRKDEATPLEESFAHLNAILEQGPDA